MGQEVLFSILPRNNFTPADLVYNRRVGRADRTSCRSFLNEDDSRADDDKLTSKNEEKNKKSLVSRFGSRIDEQA